MLPGLLALLFAAKLCATSVSLGSGASGGIFSPSLFMGATIGGAFGAAISAIHPVDGLGVTTCAMIGMAAMVGGGTGAAMTAVTMIFEMTRDYDLVMPIIVAVALAIGVRRLLSQENIYTVKLVGRRHFVPKALHANMFLVRRAGEVMERDVTLLPKDTRLETFLRQGGHEGRMKHIVVTDGDRIVGVLRVNTALRRGLEDVEQGFTVGEIAQRNYTVAREEDIVFDVVTRMARHNAGMAVVTKAKASPARRLTCSASSPRSTSPTRSPTASSLTVSDWHEGRYCGQAPDKRGMSPSGTRHMAVHREAHEDETVRALYCDVLFGRCACGLCARRVSNVSSRRRRAVTCVPASSPKSVRIARPGRCRRSGLPRRRRTAASLSSAARSRRPTSNNAWQSKCRHLSCFIVPRRTTAAPMILNWKSVCRMVTSGANASM